MKTNDFAFTCIVVQEAEGYSSLCLELDVASQGKTIPQAKDMLLDAVTLYLQTAIESNLPHMRPVPPDEGPRITAPDMVVASFPIKVDIGVRAYA